MTIHHVTRDEIRTVGGEVIVTDEIQEQEWDNLLPDLRDFAKKMIAVIGSTTDGYLIVRKYDSLFSTVASSPCLVNVHNIATITRKTAQIEAPEDTTFPVVIED